MAKERNHFSLGLWVIVVFVLFFGGLIFIGGQSWGQQLRDYVVRFPATYALPDEIKPGAFVYCGALSVGRVEQVELREGDSELEPPLWAYLHIQVDRVVPLRSDCRIVARGPLLGGTGKLIILDPGQQGALLESGAVIEGAETGSFEAALDALNAELDASRPASLLALVKTQLDPADAGSVVAKIHRSLDDVNEATARLAMQLDSAEQDALLAKLHEILNNVNLTTRRLKSEMETETDATMLFKIHAALDSVNSGLTDAAGILNENRPVIRDTLAGVRRTTDTIENDVVGPITEELNRANVSSLLSELHASVKVANESLAAIRDVSNRARSLAVANEERIDRLLADVAETAAHLKGASKDLRRNPWRLFYRPSLEETKQLNIFDAAREFSEAAARLDDSSARLRIVLEQHGGSLPSDAPELKPILDHLEQTFEDYTQAEQALWDQLELE